MDDEYLRHEALKFAGHVQETESPTYFVPPADAQNLSDQEVDQMEERDRLPPEDDPQRTRDEASDEDRMKKPVAVAADEEMNMDQERTSFLESVLDRLPPEDDPHKTHDKILETVAAFGDGRMKKSEAYAKACILLIGHADLLHEFERMLKYDDEKEDWRFHVMMKFMGQIDPFLERCKLTVETIKDGPEKLTAVHLECIERMGFDDPVERNELSEDPERYRSAVLPRLEKKLEDLERMKVFVSDYFGRALTFAGMHDDL